MREVPISAENSPPQGGGVGGGGNADRLVAQHFLFRAGQVACGAKFRSDFLQDTLCVFQDVDIPETDYAISKSFDFARADLIFDRIRVLAPINLDNQLPFSAHEIDDVIPDRMLASKADTELASSQALPKMRLCQGRLTSQLARGRCQSLSRQRSSPIPQPLPSREGEHTSEIEINAQTH